MTKPQPIMDAEAYIAKYGKGTQTFERWTVERAEGCFQNCPHCRTVFNRAKKEGRDILAQFPGNGGRVPDLVALFSKRKITGFACRGREGCAATCVIMWPIKPENNGCVYSTENSDAVWEPFFGKVVE